MGREASGLISNHQRKLARILILSPGSVRSQNYLHRASNAAHPIPSPCYRGSFQTGPPYDDEVRHPSARKLPAFLRSSDMSEQPRVLAPVESHTISRGLKLAASPMDSSSRVRSVLSRSPPARAVCLVRTRGRTAWSSSCWCALPLKLVALPTATVLLLQAALPTATVLLLRHALASLRSDS